MIKDKKIVIYTDISTIKNKFTAKLNLQIENEKTYFKSQRGIKYKSSFEYFYKEFYEYFNYYFNKEHPYYRETLDQIVFDIELETLQTKQDFNYVSNRFLDNYGLCCYYEEHYRELVLDLMKLNDFKYKRFWTKHYNQLPLEFMDSFLEDFLNSGVCKKLYSKNFLNLVKYDEYIIYQQNLSKRLTQTNYSHKFFKKTKTKIQKTYILKDKNTGYYKIGKSANPLDREKTLQAEKPTYELIKIFNKDIEKELHKKYDKQNVRGEWFNLNKIQLKYICTKYE